jgi:hypothetical protein
VLVAVTSGVAVPGSVAPTGTAPGRTVIEPVPVDGRPVTGGPVPRPVLAMVCGRSMATFTAAATSMRAEHGAPARHRSISFEHPGDRP